MGHQHLYVHNKYLVNQTSVQVTFDQFSVRTIQEQGANESGWISCLKRIFDSSQGVVLQHSEK